MTFSIAIPVFNVGPYLRDCLDSLRAQTFPDWECVCVDDGSTDKSGAILGEYAEKDDRFRIIRQPNTGVGAARNAALETVQGEWVWFVDGDDMVRPNALSIIWQAISMSSGANTVHLEYLEGLSAPKKWPDDDNTTPDVYMEACDAGLLHFDSGICSYVMRRDAIGNTRFECFSRGEDSVFLFNYVRNGFGLINLGRKLYFYRQRQESATHVIPTVEIVAETFACQRHQIQTLEESIESLGNFQASETWGRRFWNCYKTYYGMFFRLAPHERRMLIEDWLSLISLVRPHYKPQFETRIRIKLIGLIRSGLFVRRLALGKLPGLNELGQVLRVAKRCLARFSPNPRSTANNISIQ